MSRSEKTRLIVGDGSVHDALAPVILSASRSTDIPAFYGEWFRNRVRAGYSAWTNPFNQRLSYVAYSKVRAVVYWTKNPAPFMPFLDEIESTLPSYYFQFSLNDYEDEHLEPGLPPLEDRIKTMQHLSDRIGKERVIWRFDPVIFGGGLSVESLISRIARVGDRVSGYVEKLVFSYIDVSAYRKVTINLGKTGIPLREPESSEMHRFAEMLAALNGRWGLDLATCGESVDLSQYGITHNRCIDDVLMVRLFGDDPVLMQYLGHEAQQELFVQTDMHILHNPSLKDKGQRATCGCIISKDIGSYNTCTHGCVYCYANNNTALAGRNRSLHDPEKDAIV